METKIIQGESLKERIFAKVKKEISTIREKSDIIPTIAFVACVGHQPLMKYTIGLHKQAANELGFNAVIKTKPADTSEKELINEIELLNEDKNIHAIVLLQPVPKHINAIRVIEKIQKDKEVEGFHPLNVMDTLTNGIAHTKYPMCLPAALIELFQHESVKIAKGSEFVFATDQDFISNPFRNLILRTASSQAVPPDCSFTIINIDNEHIVDYCKRADYLFVISENVECIQPEWLKPGVCIVDIYSNLVDEIPSKNNAERLIPIIRGGVNTEAIINVAGSIAPCPGGLMPVLLAILFRNALIAFKNNLN
jgi:methylenetetrahydrofolate dehydrogenase (NADP+) / methenyltetrahydrofolate cyclohydrolase